MTATAQPATLTPQQIRDALRRHARTAEPATRAATELLIATRIWTTAVSLRPYLPSRQHPGNGLLYMEVLWGSVARALRHGHLIGPPGEMAILRLATSLAIGYEMDVSALLAVSAPNKTHVLRALEAALADR